MINSNSQLNIKVFWNNCLVYFFTRCQLLKNKQTSYYFVGKIPWKEILSSCLCQETNLREQVKGSVHQHEMCNLIGSQSGLRCIAAIQATERIGSRINIVCTENE